MGSRTGYPAAEPACPRPRSRRWNLGKRWKTDDGEERDDAAERVAPVVERVGHQDARAEVLADLEGDPVEPLLDHDAQQREPGGADVDGRFGLGMVVRREEC